MFFIFGIREKRIKKYNDLAKYCESCKKIPIEYHVYQKYVHIFWMPVFPLGKHVKKYCPHCNELLENVVSPVSSSYMSKTKTPIYLYTLIILFFLLIALLVNENIKTQKLKKEYLQNPEVGDVYIMRDKDENNKTVYYFQRISRIGIKKIYFYLNTLYYYQYTSKFDNKDKFVKDREFGIEKDQLKELLDKGTINSIIRHYKPDTGFNRVVNKRINSSKQD